MTELLDEAISRLRECPASEQDEATEALLAFLDRDQPAYRMSPEQLDEVRRTQEGLRDGTVRILSDEEVEAMWRRLGA